MPKKNSKNSFIRKRAIPKKVSTHGPVRFFTEDQLRAVEMLAMMGADNQQIAVYFDVHVKTIQYWMKNYPQFAEARKRGGMACSMEAANSLFRTCMGFHEYEERVFRVGTELITKRVKVYYPPNVRALMFWLSNKEREQWTTGSNSKVKYEGTVKHEHTKVDDIPVEKLSEEAKKMLFEISEQMLFEGGREN